MYIKSWRNNNINTHSMIGVCLQLAHVQEKA